jgi:hypothetical protein
MNIDLGELTGLIVIASGAVVLGMSYVAAYLMGKNVARRELDTNERRLPASPPDRIERIETAVDSIALEVERLAEGQRFLLGGRGTERRPSPLPLHRKHTTPT